MSVAQTETERTIRQIQIKHGTGRKENEMTNEQVELAPLDCLLKVFLTARKAEDDRLFVALGRCFISAWNPRVTDDVNGSRIETKVKLLKDWCQHWWLEQGYCVGWLPQPTDGDFDLPSFSLRRMR